MKSIHSYKSYINSVILGLFLGVSMITKIISSIVPLQNNIVIFVGILLVVCYIINKDAGIKLNFLIASGIIALLHIVSCFLHGINGSYVVNYLMNFVLYGVSAFFFCSVPFKYEKVLDTIANVFVLYTVLTVVKYIPEALQNSYVSYSMDVSYSMMVGVSAGFLVFKHVSKIKKVVILVAIAISMYYLLFLSDSRGAVLSLVVLIGILLFNKSNHKKAWLIFIICAGCIVFFGRDFIIEKLSASGLNMRWIIRFTSQADITTGRTRLYALALNAIRENPLLGNGIGYFETIANGQYVHNMFLQLLCEFGVIVGGAISVYILVLIFKNVFDDKDNRFGYFLICQFIPRLLLSSVYWLNPFIWVFLYLQSGKNKNKEKISLKQDGDDLK